MRHDNDNDTRRDRILASARRFRGKGKIQKAVVINMLAREAHTIRYLDP